MTGMVAIVTGGSQGIGAGLVAGYWRRAWPVVVTARPARAGQINDVVDGILFLESSPCIIGEILHIDGGQIVGH